MTALLFEERIQTEDLQYIFEDYIFDLKVIVRDITGHQNVSIVIINDPNESLGGYVFTKTGTIEVNVFQLVRIAEEMFDRGYEEEFTLRYIKALTAFTILHEMGHHMESLDESIVQGLIDYRLGHILIEELKNSPISFEDIINSDRYIELISTAAEMNVSEEKNADKYAFSHFYNAKLDICTKTYSEGSKEKDQAYFDKYRFKAVQLVLQNVKDHLYPNITAEEVLAVSTSAFKMIKNK